MNEGVEAGEDKEGHHGAESHEVVKHRLQVGGCDGGLTGLVPDVAHLLRVHKATDEILQSKEPGGAEILRALPRPLLFFIQTHAHPSCCLSTTRHTQVTHACGPLHAVPCCHIYTMVPRHDRGQCVMDNSRREALTSLAVMKKFHGSRVPRPRMKKISQTALYL